MCFRCGVSAEESPEYDVYREAGISRSDVVRQEEGTYNPDTNTFACDRCYAAIGWPTHPRGWKAPDLNDVPEC